MKYRLFLLSLFFIASSGALNAQVVFDKGVVSYVSSQNVYVKFSSTEGINIGDTLFLQNNEARIPALVVTNKSSVSCVCTKITTDPVKVSTEIAAKKVQPAPKKEEEKTEKPDSQKPGIKPVAGNNKNTGKATGEGTGTTAGKNQSRQKIRARLSAASYSNFSDRNESTRMRYSFTMQGNNIKDSRFSTDIYITFRHTLKEWEAVKNNFNDALKIYSFSVKQDINESTSLVLGRRINPRISSLGAVDGVQFEKGMGHFFAGAIAGSRPDYIDYSINPNLIQAGAYVGLASKVNEKYQESTLGIIEQRNKSAVDRRFVYFQHSDELMKNMNVFSSMEFDLYQYINNEVQNKISLTNLFVSLRYKFSKKLSASLSYDSRKNIIYYESYKSYIDQLIDNETRQGMRFGFNYRPFKSITWGANASWRFQKSNSNDSKNLNTYLNFNQIPLIKSSASITANFLQTSYINSKIYGLRLTKDIFKGKLNVEAYYRRVDYDFPVYGYSTNQNIVGGSLSWQILKKLSAYVFLEKTFDSQNNNYLMVNTKLMQRF